LYEGVTMVTVGFSACMVCFRLHKKI